MKKKKIWLILLILVISLGIAFWYFSQPPKDNLSDEFKEEAVTKLLGRKANLGDDVPKGDTEYNGKFITFKYPAKAIIYTHREYSISSASANLEDFSFDIKEPRLIFNLMVNERAANTTLDDIPSVRLREIRGEYEKGQFKIQNLSGRVFTNDSGKPEKSGYLMTDDKVYTFSITGSSLEEVEALFEKITKSAKFKSS